MTVVKVKPNHRSIYFKNNGLFAENYLVNRLPNEKRDSFVMQHWDTEALPEFNECYEWMLSAWEEYKDILPTLSEAQLEDKWIRPIFDKLGWKYEVQDRLKTRGKTQIPDYSLFASQENYKKAKGCSTDEKYFGYVEAIADAKAMGVNLDGTGKTNANPSYQIVRYLEDTDCEWGILTDGEYWRLYTTRSKSKYTTYYEVNIRKFLAPRGNSPRDDEGFKYFFNFFRQASFAQKDVAGKRFLDVVFESGERYARAVETQLKERAFRIVEMIARGFAENAPKTDSLDVIYKHSLFYLFRMLFVLNCESKGLLSINELSDYYPHSLRALAARLKDELERNTHWASSTRSYDSVASLLNMIRKGDKGLGLAGFGDALFKSGDSSFFDRCKIPDALLNRALVELSCAYSDDGDLQFIDYAKLGPDHIGSVFEGLLEFELRRAEKDILFDSNGEICDSAKATDEVKKSGERIKAGEIYLAAGSGERKRTGSYYTPDYIVDYIVRKTLDPLCSLDDPDKIFQVKVCDPAMGSGHFLLGALRYLEEKALAAIYKSDDKASELDPADIRWRLLHSCIFGVDINPLAVELAKYSLWMYAAREAHRVEPLDEQLFCGDAMNISKILPSKPSAFVGNPPYINAVILSKDREYQNDLKERFVSAVGAFDLCSLFVEACKRASPDSRVGFILPNKLINSKGLNIFLKEDKRTFIESLDDLSSLPVFKDASVYPVVMCFSAVSNKKVLVRKHVDSFSETAAFEKKVFSDEDALPLVGLTGISSENTTGIKMGELAEICGAATVSEAYEFVDAVSEKSGKNRVPFVVSGNIIGFALSWGYEGTRYLKTTYSSPYLDLGHEIIKERRKTLYRTKKIVIANMTRGLRAYVDGDGALAPGKSTTIIYESKIPLEALAAFLNSKSATAQYRNQFEGLQLNGGALRIGPPELSELKVPSRLLKDSGLQKRAVASYQKIAAEIQRLLAAGTKVSSLKKALDDRKFQGMPQLNKLFSELDALFDDTASEAAAA